MKYPDEFPSDVNFVIGQSDPRRDWNYCQPPRIGPDGRVRETMWTITFDLAEPCALPSAAPAPAAASSSPRRPITFPATALKPGTNTLHLRSQADVWHHGVLYDCVRLDTALQ